ncbi:hypothetical protein HK103_007466 [Boothiomyces macroporosus]|uniref:Leucine Rich Repeat family protein n=1 Tax=Boothiomyces macroporosus TaxID=261099 RepID=A0AAD5UGJ9_9FUNG|nr:hypothetical protein HK103_007466 [Boothiomyces macroporosus]
MANLYDYIQEMNFRHADQKHQLITCYREIQEKITQLSKSYKIPIDRIKEFQRDMDHLETIMDGIDHLTLDSNDNECIEYLSVGLQKNVTISRVSLELDCINRSNCKYLSEALQNENIVELGFAGFVENGNYIPQVIHSNKGVKVFWIESCYIEPLFFRQLFQSLETTSIYSLQLSYCHLTYEQVQLLAEGISRIRVVTSLDLRSNGLDSEGVRLIANALRSNTNILNLDLSGNNLDNEGLIAISVLIKENIFLTHLNLTVSECIDTGAKGFAKALQSNQTLTCLVIDDLSFNSTFVKHLSVAIKQHQYIEILKLNVPLCNDMEDIDMIVKDIFRNKSLRMILIAPYVDSNITKVTELVAQNRYITNVPTTFEPPAELISMLSLNSKRQIIMLKEFFTSFRSIMLLDLSIELLEKIFHELLLECMIPFHHISTFMPVLLNDNSIGELVSLEDFTLQALVYQCERLKRNWQ